MAEKRNIAAARVKQTKTTAETATKAQPPAPAKREKRVKSTAAPAPAAAAAKAPKTSTKTSAKTATKAAPAPTKTETKTAKGAEKASTKTAKSAATEKPEAKEFKYGVADLQKLLGHGDPASTRVALRKHGIEKAGKSYGWNSKDDLEAVAKKIKAGAEKDEPAKGKDAKKDKKKS